MLSLTLTGIIPKTSKIERLRENIDLFDFELDEGLFVFVFAFVFVSFSAFSLSLELLVGGVVVFVFVFLSLLLSLYLSLSLSLSRRCRCHRCPRTCPWHRPCACLLLPLCCVVWSSLVFCCLVLSCVLCRGLCVVSCRVVSWRVVLSCFMQLKWIASATWKKLMVDAWRGKGKILI